MSTIVSVVCVL